MDSKSKQLTARLIELRNAIKRKYKAFKEGIEETEIKLEKQYKPIITELKKQSKFDPVDIKEEQMDFKEENPTEEFMDYQSTNEDEFEPQTMSTPRAIPVSPSTTQFIEDFFKNPVTREYMGLFIRDSTKQKMIDYIYGPRYEDNEKLMIGEKELDFDEEGNILIGGTNYGSSEGLYELIFKKVPDSKVYKETDLNAYKSILNSTNAHKEGNIFTGKVKRNNSTKYTRIIKKLFPPLTSKGKGLSWKNIKSQDIIYWDNVNELVDRLRHIAMSTESGNRIHNNEILGIIEELREAGYIKGTGNSRFKSLLQ